MTDVLVGKRIEDPLSDVESLINNGYLQIRPARPYAAGGQWVDDAWSAPIPMTGTVLTFKLDPIASVPYELFWHYTDGRNQVKEGSEFRYVTSSGTALKWEDLVQEAGPGAGPALPGSAEARLLALETLYSTLTGGASTTGGITDMSPAARIFNQQTSYANMRTTLGAGTASTKTDVGLGNVDNTADTAKPVSTAQATALALKADTTALAAKADATALTAKADLVSGAVPIGQAPAWTEVKVFCPGGVQPTRPTTRTDIIVDYISPVAPTAGGYPNAVAGVDTWENRLI